MVMTIVPRISRGYSISTGTDRSTRVSVGSSVRAADGMKTAGKNATEKISCLYKKNLAVFIAPTPFFWALRLVHLYVPGDTLKGWCLFLSWKRVCYKNIRDVIEVVNEAPGVRRVKDQ